MDCQFLNNTLKIKIDNIFIYKKDQSTLSTHWLHWLD